MGKNMQVSLVSPDERQFLINAGDREPLGIEYLSASLKLNNVRTKLYDLNHQPVSLLLNDVWSDRPDLVGLSVPSSPSYEDMKELGNLLKKNSRVVFGGKGIISHEQELKNLGFDVVVGDGEQAIIDILNGSRGIIQNEIEVNSVPIPDRESLKSNSYNMQVQSVKTAPIVSSRGCPHSCTFCGNVAKKPKFRSLDNINSELEQLSGKYDGVYFYDENFLKDKVRAKQIIKMCDDLNLKYRIEARANDITDEMASYMHNCMLVAIGIESADNKVLKRIKKGENLEQITHGIMTLYRYNVPTKGYFIMGLPEQDLESGRKSIAYARRLLDIGALVQADFYALTPFPGSPIGDNPSEHGVRVLHRDYSKYLVANNSQVEPVIETDWLSSNQIKQLLTEANVR